MKYTRIAAVAAFFSSVLLLVGCATPGSVSIATAPTVTSFAATATKVCNVLQPVAKGMQTTMSELEVPLDESETDSINAAVDKINTFCGAVATVNVSDVQTLVDATFPVLTQVVQKSSMSANSKDLAIIGLNGAQTAIEILVPSVTPAQPVPAIVTTPTSTTSAGVAQ